MIGMSFDPASLKEKDKLWWDDWTARAEAATWKAIDAFEVWLQKPDGPSFKYKEFSEPLWKELKEWYRVYIFHKKCAYCESRFSRFKGDAEHYRPKSSVKCKGIDGKFVYPTCTIPDPMTGGSKTIKHPGYFWLAYDWRNLIPACTFCNSGRGKNDRFEIKERFAVLQKLSIAELDALPADSKPRESRRWPGFFYPSPQALDLIEAPLLLNPLNPTESRDPRKYLRFGVRGLVTAVDGLEPGSISMDMLQLEEDDLREERQKAQEYFQRDYFEIISRTNINDWPQATLPLLRSYRTGTMPFSAASLDFLEDLKLRFR
jgi:hypothetical protein